MNLTLYGHRVFAGHTRLGWVLNPATAVHIREGRFGHRDTQRKDSCVTVQAEIGVTQLQVKKCDEWTTVSRSWERQRRVLPLELSEGAWPC